MKEKKKMTVVREIKLMLIGSAIVSSLLIGSAAIILSMVSIKNDYSKMAEISNSHLRDVMENGSADWTYDAESGVLMCAGRELGVELFDTINKSDSSVFHTIFWNDERVLTNIKNEDGKYAIGTKADSEIYAKVKSGETYTQNGVKIFGSKYTVCYMPIYSNGAFCGMVFTGIEQSMVDKSILSISLSTATASIVTLILIILVSSRLLRKISGVLTKRLNHGYNQLHDFSENVTVISRKTDKGVVDITTAMNNVASGATSQAAATEEAMASTEEFTANIDMVNEEIRQSFDLIEAVQGCVKASEDSISELNRNIDDNNTIVAGISEDIENGVRCSRNVKAVVKTIDDLAFQINLLALNAAVEASHAGEFGKGFAVVADEIKNLANNSAQSASETADIINEIVESMNKTASSNEKLVTANKVQLEKAGEVQRKMDDLGSHVSDIETKLGNIRQKSEALITVKNELVTVVQNLSATAEENAAISEEVCASTETVGSDVHELEEKVETIGVICEQLKKLIEYFG